ncbi:Hypothetical protein PBC10988_26970 [Planctomycetales bacterium 10988]|nr:Hypothetical protein PBC10988_26970 [Planctomycetales bacterium 10988]
MTTYYLFARNEGLSQESLPPYPSVLLEGDWPETWQQPWRWSLDETIDGQFGWLDRKACQLADRAADAAKSASQGSPLWQRAGFVYALKLRYYCLRLLRVLVFLDGIWDCTSQDRLVAILCPKRDADLAQLLKQARARDGFSLDIRWQMEPQQCELIAESGSEPTAAGLNQATREGLRKVCTSVNHGVDWLSDTFGASEQEPSPILRFQAIPQRVLLCGNPRFLEPICQSLVEQKGEVAWLWQKLALNVWRKWRPRGVRQFLCDEPATTSRIDAELQEHSLHWRRIDLTPILEAWLQKAIFESGEKATSWANATSRHLENFRPDMIVIDEDATPFKRILLSEAKRLGAKSVVVQHGVPCVAMGFVPMLADATCCWGSASQEQFVRWGIPASRLLLTGAPHQDEQNSKKCFLKKAFSSTKEMPGKERRHRILLLATKVPQSARADSAMLHLTRKSYQRLIEEILQVFAGEPDAELLIKRHPRCEDHRFWQQFAAIQEGKVRVVQHVALETLLTKTELVLSCASSAGMEAAWLGWPVVQLLPSGAGEVLPAESWRLLGSARNGEELAALWQAWQASPPGSVAEGRTAIFHETGKEASQRVLEALAQIQNRQLFARTSKRQAATPSSRRRAVTMAG